MKTKLHSSSNSSPKSIVKCHGILSFLFILFMTVSSFGQSEGISFQCGSVLFDFNSSPEDGNVNGYSYWINGTDNAGANGTSTDTYLLFVQVNPDTNLPRWEVHKSSGTFQVNGDNEPVFGTFGELYFYSPDINDDGISPPCDVDWVIEETFLPCSVISAVNVVCTGPPITEPCQTWYLGVDNDGDTYFGSQLTAECENPGGYSLTPPNIDDCDDTDAEEFPGQTWYTDADGDGFGNMDDTGTISCEKPEGKVSNNDDCDDDDGAINPGAEEVCDGIDNNCDGNIDEGLEDEGCYEWCGDVEKQNKVVMCHNGKDICVSINAIDAHIAHGDSLNSCSSKSANNGKGEKAEEIPTSYDVAFWPNPSNNNFNVKLITPNVTEKVSIEAYDINGRLMHSNIINGNENYQFGNNLSTGIYIVKLTQESTTKMIKVVKQ